MLYDITKSFEENITFGPFWHEKFPTIKENAQLVSTFLGYRVNSLFGISACPLTVNSRFINVVSKLGFDILTYKSVRSVEWHGNPFPHWQYAKVSTQLSLSDLQTSFRASFKPFNSGDQTMFNSFGIQSINPEYWQSDVDATQANLAKGQLLILSLMCTPQTGEKLVADAKRLAKLANETNVDIFELNLACPNTDGGQGLIYEDVAHSLKLTEAVKKEIGSKKLLIKVGYYKNQTDLKKFMMESKGMIDGISSTNTYIAKAESAEGQDAFPSRPMAGLSGAAIRSLSLEQAANAIKFAHELALKNFAVVGIGGVTQPAHINQYLELGIQAVQTAVGAFADPYLATRYKKGKT